MIVERSSPSILLQKICQLVFLCSLHAMLAALARCIASSALSSLRAFCNKLARSFLKAKKKASCPCLCSSRAEIWERMRSFRCVVWMCAGVFSPSYFKWDVYLPTSSASLKTGTIAVLTMRDFSIKEISSTKRHILRSLRTCPSSSPSSLWLSQPFYTVMLNRGCDV